MHHVLDNIREHLSEYMTVSLELLKIDHYIELTNTILKRPKQLHSKLGGQSLKIVDRINSEESVEIVKALKKSLKPYLTDQKCIAVGKRDMKGVLNFRIIHNDAYYEEVGLKDEYLASTDEIQRQHITIEDTGVMTNSAVKTIVKELLIKRDIADRNISLFDWGKLQTQENWKFAICDDEAKQIIFMDIYPDGCFEFSQIDSTSLFGYGEYQKYIDLIKQHRKDEWKTGFSFEGLIVSEDEDINLIFRTNEISLPDLAEIKAIIKEVGSELPEGKRSGFELAEQLEIYSKRMALHDERNIKSLIDDLKMRGAAELSKVNFRQTLNNHLGKNTKIASGIRGFFYNEHGVRLIFSKNKESLEDLFDASLNIKYFGEKDNEAYYFVGKRSENVQKYSFASACHIRKIIAVNNSRLIFQELLPTMDVDFVRTGQSTVVPFPFKYLREYMKFKK